MAESRRYEFLIVGSGAGGATLARELSRRGRDVLLLEQGQPQPKVGTYETCLRFYDVNRLTQMPKRSKEGVIIWRAFGAGGSTLVSCGNGMPCLVDELAEYGITIEAELAEVGADLKIAPIDERLLSEGSHQLARAARELGYTMERIPKFIDADRCRRCGNCVLGCQPGARWTSVSYLEEAQQHGAEVRYGITVTAVLIEHGRAHGVQAITPQGPERILADVVILAAGGLSTPVILQQSGISKAGEGLFVDIMVNAYGVTEGLNQIHEPQMALVDMEFHKEEGFLLSPFVTHPRRVRFLAIGPKGFALPTQRLLGIMTKITDEASGRVTPDGTVFKAVTERDAVKIRKGVTIAREILAKAGVDPTSILETKPAGAHPGGTAAIGRVVGADLQTEVDRLFVCDASVLPVAPGAPPIMTIAALAKRLAKMLAADHE